MSYESQSGSLRARFIAYVHDRPGPIPVNSWLASVKEMLLNKEHKSLETGLIHDIIGHSNTNVVLAKAVITMKVTPLYRKILFQQ